MKKLLAIALAMSFIATPAFAHRGRDNWIGPAIIGSIIGGVILYHSMPPPPRYYYRTRCLEEQVYDAYGRPLFDAYGNPITRVVCR